MELVSLYPYDPTARATSNKIVNESITVIPPSQITDYSYVVPRAAPFFAETLVVKDGKGVGARTLVENVDYWCVIDFLSASVGLTKRVSVGIALLDPNYSGTLYVSYQTLGGNYTMADYSVLEELIRERYVVKHVSYEQIINLPAGFSPEWHSHEVADMVGMSSVVASLDNIKVATESRNGSYGQIEQQLRNHVNSAAAHTPADIGLGNVKNYGIATLTDAKGGSVSKYVTADILKQYVAFDKTDTSVYLLKTEAALTYQTKTDMGNYHTKVVADGRYALKSDSYTKIQVDALISGIDISAKLADYYTKSQSDGRYASKSDLGSYSTTLVADGKYATKLSLNGYYTKVDTDGKYALKTQSYTKSASDDKYALKTDLNQFLNLSALESRFVPLVSLNNYYTKTQVDAAQVTSLAFMPQPDGEYMLQLTETKSNKTAVTKQAKLTLTNHFKKSEVYTKGQVDNLLTNNSIVTSTKIYTREFTTTTKYRSYSLPTKWKLRYTPLTGILHVSVVVSGSFYHYELTRLTLTSGPAPFQNGRNTPAVLTFSEFDARPFTLTPNNDTWFSRDGNVINMPSGGDLKIEISFSSHGGSEYVPSLGVTVAVGVENATHHACVMQWFNESNAWISGT